jgi:hypothetical protein
MDDGMYPPKSQVKVKTYECHTNIWNMIIWFVQWILLDCHSKTEQQWLKSVKKYF